MKICKIAAFAGVALMATGAANAATMSPAEFETIITEGQRTATIQGEATGVGTMPDVTTFAVPGTQMADLLLVGRAVSMGSDQFDVIFGTNSKYKVTFEIAESSREGESPFSAMLSFGSESVTLGGTDTDVESFSFASNSFALGTPVSFEVRGIQGKFDYDISVAAVPLPAGIALLAGGLGLLGAAGRRKRKAA